MSPAPIIKVFINVNFTLALPGYICFNEHMVTVKDTIAPERLLVYEISEGWEPLCNFLSIPVPLETPFPRVNEGHEIKKAIKAVRIIRILPYAAGITVMIWLMYYLIPN